MPLQATSGAASYDAFGGGVPIIPNYIEEVFSTHLYTGNGSTQTITNNIDLSTKGGLTWIKSRSGTTAHRLTDTARGATKSIESNAASAQITEATGLTAFNTTGFTIGADADYNTNAATYVSWTFRKQPKFFDVVTYTGDGTTPRSIPHNLGSTPGCVIIKMVSTSADWYVYHRGLPTTTGTYLRLNSSAGPNINPVIFPASPVNSTAFKVGSGADVNASGETYVAYVFAHDAGGFGLTGTDNVISCGSYTGTSATQLITLGYEPQWILVKDRAAPDQEWIIIDNMRGMSTTRAGANVNRGLRANSTIAEYDSSDFGASATGFFPDGDVNNSGNTYIYIAIRRGLMKVPTDPTKVFAPLTGSYSAAATVTTGFPTDLTIITNRGGSSDKIFEDSLRGYQRTTSTGFPSLASNSDAIEDTTIPIPYNRTNTTLQIPTFWSGGSPGAVLWNFRRAPSFFDEVCYTGTGANTTRTHNLGVVPELIIVKRRNVLAAWNSYSATLAATQYLVLNTNAAAATGATRWNSTGPTSSVFSLGTSATVNASGGTYAAYLFATCAGVSKVGSYTGNGSTQTIDCGFGAGGARFVLIKRTDSTGDWYVYDTSRGMTTLTDPYLLLNDAAAETATLGSVTAVSTGFALNSTILAAINVNAGTYIFLAIA